MGYDLHITKEPDDPDDSGDASNCIELADWLAIVEADPELRLVGVAEVQSPSGETIRYESEGLAVWTGCSGPSSNDSGPWFDFRRGRIIVAEPDDETVVKMCGVAAALGARVRGDDGEFYPLADESGSAHSEPPLQSRSWWRKFLGG